MVSSQVSWGSAYSFQLPVSLTLSFQEVTVSLLGVSEGDLYFVYGILVLP